MVPIQPVRPNLCIKLNTGSFAAPQILGTVPEDAGIENQKIQDVCMDIASYRMSDALITRLDFVHNSARPHPTYTGTVPT
jgi:hypothetical protein